MTVSVTRLWRSYMTDTLTNAATTITGILLLFFMDDENDDDDDTSSESLWSPAKQGSC